MDLTAEPCLICMCDDDTIVLSNKMIKLDCNHYYCIHCLTRWFNYKLDSDKKCCYCQKVVTEDDLKLLPVRRMDLSNQNLTEIPKDLPETLEVLIINDNQITKLENLPKNLKRLFISSNQIAVIENLPKQLRHLWIVNNNVSIVKILPKRLKVLCIWGNCIDDIGDLPDTLEVLHIGRNPIDIPKLLISLPESLVELRADTSQKVLLERLEGHAWRSL